MKKTPVVAFPALLCFLLISTSIFAQRQNLLFESSFEWTNGTYLNGLANNQHCLSCPYAVTRTTASARSGAGAVRFEVHDDDPMVSGSIRAELTVPGVTDSGERWYGMSFFLKDWIPDGSEHSIVQWHPDSSSGSAVLGLFASDGVITIIHGNPFIGSPVRINAGEIHSDVWTDIVFHVKWDSTNNGYIEVWRDGIWVYDTSGIRTSWARGQYLKAGINHFGWSIPVIDTAHERIYYMDDVRIGNGDATYNDVAPMPPQRKELIFANGFEGPVETYLQGFDNYQHCCEYSVTQTQNNARSGANALRLEVRDDDDLVSGSIRAELTLTNITDSGERWYGMSFFLKDWIDDASPHTIVQWNPVASGGAVLAVMAHEGVFTLVHGHSEYGHNYVDIGNIVSDTWTDFVFHVKWSQGNDGYIEVWKNGQMVFDTSGIQTEWEYGQYMKLGINHYGWTIPINDTATERILYVDDVFIGNGDAGYADVSPGGVNSCIEPKATLRTTEACDGEPYYLILSDAQGPGPFDLWINDTTYYDVSIGDSIQLFAAEQEHIFDTIRSHNETDDAAVTLGVKFKSGRQGFVKGIRFFSHTSPAGTYSGHLWKANGSLLASATFSNVTGADWQEVLFNDPVLIDADSVYIAAYFTSEGLYAASPTELEYSITNGSLTSLPSIPAGGNGVYAYGSSPAFPNNTFGNTNYWADLIFVAVADTIQLLGVTDTFNCTRTGDLQVIKIASQECPGMVTAPSKERLTDLAGQYTLGQNYPNPYRGVSTIQFSLPQRSPVNISLFDINGRLIKRLVNGYKDAGVHMLQMQAGSLPAGIYYYRMQAGRFTKVKKMIVQ
jgi:hypothetical protein